MAETVNNWHFADSHSSTCKFYLAVHAMPYPVLHTHICLSVCLSVCLSIRLSVCLTYPVYKIVSLFLPSHCIDCSSL